MIIDIIKNKSVFSRAWREQVVPKYGIDACSEFTVEEAGEVWHQEFGFNAITDKYNKFRYAEFKDDSQASWFLLKWS